MIKKTSILFLVMMVIWLLPFFQYTFGLFEVEKLGGVNSQVEQDVVLDGDKWLSGEYSEKKESFLNDNFGFREIAIKGQNQIQYWLFGKTNAEDIILGKNNYLYELKYIRSYYGVDYMGEKYFIDKLEKLQFIQDTLNKLGKTFILIIAPSKARYLPEFIPSKYKTDSVNSNYNSLTRLLTNYKINYINYQAMFNRLKTTTKYQLYPYAGTHWSEYGNTVALDSLKAYIEKKTKFSLPVFDYSNIKISDGYEGTDNDMGKAINLLFPPDYGSLAYPQIVIKENEKTNKPSLLMVADSYWSSIYFSFIPAKLFKTHSFWSYYSVSYDYNHETNEKSPIDLDFGKEISSKDIVCVMCTEPNLKVMGYRFIEDCYDYFKNGKLDINYRKQMSDMLKHRLFLWNDKKASDLATDLAISQKVSVDSIIMNMTREAFK